MTLFYLKYYSCGSHSNNELPYDDADDCNYNACIAFVGKKSMHFSPI